MPRHRAGREFFERKREWSERKDLVLDYYLRPYLAKIATLRRPILLIDGFAGAGEYGDGSPGSPLILARRASEALEREPTLDLRLICIEADSELHGRLAQQLDGVRFAEAWHGEFLAHVPALARLASQASTFLYLDPYTARGLDWRALATFFGSLHRGQSVEILLNFNSGAFARWGLQALRFAPSLIESTTAEETDLDHETESPAIEHLDRIVGGPWWQDVLRSETDYPAKVNRLATSGL